MSNGQGARRSFLMERLSESNVLVVDPEVCVGCRTCELMCSLHHTGQFDLARSRLYVARRPFDALFTPEVCRQCLAPACYVVCPVEGAMTIDGTTGARLIVAARCVGCGECARACPWNGDGHIIRPNAATSVYEKCDLCGGAPRCVAYCPVHALTYVAKEGR
jgi:carbon-monoxide dehydrogenase iron sulfur subunit